MGIFYFLSYQDSFQRVTECFHRPASCLCAIGDRGSSSTWACHQDTVFVIGVTLVEAVPHWGDTVLQDGDEGFIVSCDIVMAVILGLIVGLNGVYELGCLEAAFFQRILEHLDFFVGKPVLNGGEFVESSTEQIG